MSTLVNNWLGGVFGPTTDEETIANQLTRLPAFARQLENYHKIATQLSAGVPQDDPRFPEFVEIHNKIGDALHTITQLDGIAREALAQAIEAGQIRQVGDDQYDLAGWDSGILGVTLRVALVLGALLVAGPWLAVFAGLVTLMDWIGEHLSTFVNAARATGVAINDAGHGIQAATIPLIILAALWLYSKWKKGRG